MNITYQKIMSFNPCYDPVIIGMPDDYSASIIEFITNYRDKVLDKEDILWVLLRPEFMPDRDLRLYAVWCARQVQHLMKDKRSINALDVAEKYANGLATEEVLSNAWESAHDATIDARTVSATWAARAVRDASSDPKSASWQTAAWDASWAAARAASWVAAWEAWEAREAREARDMQINKLFDYFKTAESGDIYNWSE